MGLLMPVCWKELQRQCTSPCLGGTTPWWCYKPHFFCILCNKNELNINCNHGYPSVKYVVLAICKESTNYLIMVRDFIKLLQSSVSLVNPVFIKMMHILHNNLVDLCMHYQSLPYFSGVPANWENRCSSWSKPLHVRRYATLTQILFTVS